MNFVCSQDLFAAESIELYELTVKLLQHSLKAGLSFPCTNGMDVFIECFQDLPLQLPPRSLDDKNNHCKYLNTHCRGLAVDCMRKKWWHVVVALNMLAPSHREAAPVHTLAAVQSWNW